MIIFKQLVLGSFLVFAMLSLQACFWSGPSGQYASTTHTLCDNNGGNCLACDDNQNCHAPTRRTEHHMDLRGIRYATPRARIA